MGMVVNFFFSGFVIGKVPFPLSPRFRLMLQRGIDLATLDVRYFTSLSYYILLLFGLRGVFMLVFRCGVGPWHTDHLHSSSIITCQRSIPHRAHAECMALCPQGGYARRDGDDAAPDESHGRKPCIRRGGCI
jgi:hypothetical protein